MSLASVEEFEVYRRDVRNGRFGEALERLNRNWDQSLTAIPGSEEGIQILIATLPVWLAEGFLRGPCLVLGSLAGPKSIESRLQALGELRRLCDASREELSDKRSTTWPLLESIGLRCQLVQWARGLSTEADAGGGPGEPDLESILTDLQKMLQTAEWQGRGIQPSMSTPAVYRRLRHRWPWVGEALQEMADKPACCPLGWLDPGLGLLMRILERVWEPQAFDGSEDNPRSTSVWIPLAVHDPEWTSPNSTGWRARFEVRRLEGKGNGSLIPSIHHSSHLLPDTGFQRSLATAWAVVLQHAPETDWRESDYEWRMKLQDPSDEAVVSPSAESPLGNVHRRLRFYASQPFAGESGTLAIACSLRAAAAGEDLDPQIITSAWFGNDPDPADNPRLSPVVGVDLKVLAGRQDPMFMASDQWLLSKKQTYDGTIEPKPLTAETFEDAYRQFTTDGTQTRAYRAYCVKAREEHFQKYSFGLEAYHPPRIERLVEAGTPEENWQLLQEDDQKAVLSGRVWRNEAWGKRIRLRADSGMGKTTLLQWCAGEIACDEQQWRKVPIVLQNLAEYFASTDMDRLYQRLADRDDFQKVVHSSDRTQRVKWLRRRFERGDVVLLLDAVDQMASNRDQMRQVLRENVKDCHVLLTGRPAEVGTADDAEIEWIDLQLQPFDEEQARTYLGDRQLADRLFELLDVKDAEGERLPGGVLTVPLLLYLLRQFATDNRESFVNAIVQGGKFAGRPQLYELVLSSAKGLVGRGVNTLTADGKKIWRTAEQANTDLASLAWCHLTNRSNSLDFELSLQGNEFAKKVVRHPNPWVKSGGTKGG